MKKNYVILLIIFLNCTNIFCQNDADIDLSFINQSYSNGVFYYYESDTGKIIFFKTPNSESAPLSGINRMNNDGSLDNDFKIELRRTNIRAVDKQNDGKFIISHSGINNEELLNFMPTSKIIRLNSDLTTDTTFNGIADFPENIKIIEVQNDNKILFYDPISKIVKRLNEDGSIDSNFNINIESNFGATSIINQISIDINNKILIAGKFDTANSINAKNLIRLNEDGTLDASFSTLTINSKGVNKFIFQDDNKIITIEGTSIVRYNVNGTRDNSFSILQGVGQLNSIDIQNNGKIIVGCENYLSTSNSFNAVGLFRLNSDGSLDNTFDLKDGFKKGNSEQDVIITNVQVTNTNAILVFGFFDTYQNVQASGIIQLIGDVNSLDTESFKKENLIYYPNPTKNKIFIPLSKNNNLSYKVYSILGKEVNSGILTNGFLDISKLSEGIYYVYLKNNSEEIKFKIIKN